MENKQSVDTIGDAISVEDIKTMDLRQAIHHLRAMEKHIGRKYPLSQLGQCKHKEVAMQ
ncbi:MAG TPA: hypothetical protein VF681_01430 [Abditibacteriaceae bacterium]|jgi:hypothetical protein